MPLPEQAGAAARDQRGREEGERGLLGLVPPSPSGSSTASSRPPTAVVIEQHVYQIAPEMNAIAVESGRKTKSRTYRPHAVCAGFEAVERAGMLGRGPPGRRRGGRPPEGAVRRPGQTDLVLLPTHLGLTIHESHRPLDRARSRARATRPTTPAPRFSPSTSWGRSGSAPTWSTSAATAPGPKASRPAATTTTA